MLLLWEGKVLIREIWLNIYLTEMLNSNENEYLDYYYIY